MRRLILMRHAKSDWSNGGLSDHDRPLNARGRRAAPLMGTYLTKAGLEPDLAIVSSAVRATETWERTGLPSPRQIQPALYHASAETALRILNGAPDSAETLLLLWHQPGIQDAANALLSVERVDHYPTGKVAVLRFDTNSWADVRFGTGVLCAEMAPKELG